MDQIVIGENVIGTVVAITEQDHVRGLMFKPWPPPVMTFPYKTAEVRKFWMKNTPSPLDIIFCRAGEVISVFMGEPGSMRHIGPDEPVDLVVEMPFGMAQALGIGPGQSVKLCQSISTIASGYTETLRKIVNK